MKAVVLYRCQREGKIFKIFRKQKPKKVCLKNGEIELFEEGLSRKTLKKRLDKKEKKLYSKGFGTVIKALDIKTEKELLELEKLEKKVFLKFSYPLYKEYLKILELKPYKMRVLLIDKDLSAIDKEFLERLCFYSSNCSILTENIRFAEDLADIMQKQNGYYIEIKNSVKTGDFDAVFDLRKRVLKVAEKVYIDNIDFGISELSKYNVSSFEVQYVLEKMGYKTEYIKTTGHTAYFKIKNQQS